MTKQSHTKKAPNINTNLEVAFDLLENTKQTLEKSSKTINLDGVDSIKELFGQLQITNNNLFVIQKLNKRELNKLSLENITHIISIDNAKDHQFLAKFRFIAEEKDQKKYFTVLEFKVNKKEIYFKIKEALPYISTGNMITELIENLGPIKESEY